MRARIIDSAIREAIEECRGTGKDELWLWDGALSGFGVRATPVGATLHVKYRVGGGRKARQRKLKIGRFGPLNAIQGRAQAQAILRKVARGEDPAGERDGQRNDPTIAELLGEFLEHHVDAKRRRTTVIEYRRLADKFIRPSLGKIRVKELETADVARLHRKLAETPYQANRVLAVVSKFASWTEANGYRPKYSNPARGIEKYAEQGRERYLVAAEIERLGKVLAEAGDEWPTAIAAIRLLLFTGARLREVLRLRWDQVDMERGIARLDDAKTGRRNIQLSAPALKVLANLPRRPNNRHVIWGRRPGTHLVNLHDCWERVRIKADLPGVRVHDLRHSVGSIAVAGGASLRLVGAVLGHASVITSGRYAHVAADPAKAVAEKVGAEIDALLTKGAAARAGRGV